MYFEPPCIFDPETQGCKSLVYFEYWDARINYIEVKQNLDFEVDLPEIINDDPRYDYVEIEIDGEQQFRSMVKLDGT